MLNDTSLIHVLNRDETVRLIPIIIYLITVCLFGLCGNGLSLYIFTTDFKRSNSRMFFIYLSSIEIFACIVLIPFDVAAMFRQLTFRSTYLCVTYIFLLIFQVSIAGDALVIIAVDRWRKICHPFQWQLTYKLSKFLCITIVFFGFAESVPSLWLYGIHPVHVVDYNITGYECSISDNARATVYPVLYITMFWLVTIIRITLLSVLYYRIIKAVREHDKLILNRVKQCTTETGSSYSTEQTANVVDRYKEIKHEGNYIITCSENECSKRQFSNDRCEPGENDSLCSLTFSDHDIVVSGTCGSRKEPQRNHSIGSGMINDRANDNLPNVERKVDLKQKMSRAMSSEPCPENIKNSKRSRTVTIIMLTVTITCVVIYTPYLVLASLRAVVDEYECVLSNKERVVYKFFIRSYFLKSVVNPLVYGIFDPRFRQAAKAIFKRRRMCF